MKKESTTTTKKQTLISKLVEVLADLGPIEKKSRNPHFGYNYISESQILSELRHRLSSRGVFLTTSVESCVPQYGEPKAGTFVLVTTKHTFIDAESGEQLPVGGSGLGWDSGDKGVYKAITGAIKYALMKNFLITDEDDPESGEQAPEGKPAGATGHRRTKAYEEQTTDGDAKATQDLLELKSFLTEHHIPDGFLLRLLQEKKLIDGHTKNVAQLKPGILRRVLSPKSLDNLKAAWAQQEKDDDTIDMSPAKSEPAAKKTKTKEKDYDGDPHPFDRGEEVRTNEGDQTPTGERQPVSDDITPEELLEQEGYDDWREVEMHFSKDKGTLLGKMPQKKLQWWIGHYKPEQFKGKWQTPDLVLDAALVLASRELGGGQ